ncbi:MAG: hypothetical protein QMC96_05965 [Methanomicrobiales archaeon]|nr:hypothetical protein [Methanomicrobiales archaeon]
MSGSMFEGTALVEYIVRKLHEKDPHKQIGKTIVQKIGYLLTRQLDSGFNYSMYHYGPYSGEVASELELASEIGLVTIRWEQDKGYFIEPGRISYEHVLDAPMKDKINAIVAKYGHYNALTLSIIATALYVKDNFDVSNDDELVEVVASLKPQHDKIWIKQTLKDAHVL